MTRKQHHRIVLGLKVRQLRQEKGWNFEELSRRTGISVSYLNEIEKGKKYPQPENLGKLSTAFGVTPDFLTSPELTKQFAPIGDLLHSNFLSDLPLELFGIDLQQVVEIIARAPDRVNAFISAMLEIARNYSLREENFYFAALRAYQELHMNYFADIEDAAELFVQRHGLPDNGAVSAHLLADLLVREYDYKIDEKGLSRFPELSGLRSVFLPRKRRLLLNHRLTERQRAFQLAKEIGFNTLQLRERPFTSNLLRINSFEEVLNNYKAAYFAVSVLINRHAFVGDLGHFFDQPQWDPLTLQQLMSKYQVSPEVLFQRFNVLSGDFDVHKVFFLRFIHDLDKNRFDIDKELHLNRRHQPHATGLDEHYCRRWLSLTLLQDLQRKQLNAGDNAQLLLGAQRAAFLDTGEEYLVFSVAKPGLPTPRRNVSVSLGILLDEHARHTVRFCNDPNIPTKVVNVTCQRCALPDCLERAAEPVVVQRREDRKRMLEVLQKLTDK